ncbi:hypothetical protein NPIL_318891 [Nephila pilipes]|uniref:Uncharacterized protein n=1 Tax=Nephila pilipes TaxID=299642 RepID=A0A8X6UH84_NEPPI|nr:hypothetical protein NPIL_318891 [Nephila pilipes]
MSMFHMSTTISWITHAGVLQIQQWQSADCLAVYMTALGGSHLSIPIDWMDGIGTPVILNISRAKSLLVTDLETEEAMETCNVC